MARLDYLKTSPSETKSKILDFLKNTSSKVFKILSDTAKVEKKYNGNFSTKFRDIKKALRKIGFMEERDTKHKDGKIYRHRESDVNQISFCKSQKDEDSVAMGTLVNSVLNIIGFTKKEFQAVLQEA